MILFVGKDTTLFRSSSIRYRGWLYFGLINDYNAARAGLVEEAEAKEAEERYTAHLRRVAEIKAMVKVDLAGAGY